MEEKTRKKSLAITVGMVLAIALGMSVLFAVAIGSAKISIKDVYSVIGYELFKIPSLVDYGKGAIHDIVWLIRLPRIILAVAVGIGLSVSGIAMQAIVKNPLADPYILGVSSGAYLGATLAIMLGIGAFLGSNFVGISAFMGAFLISVLVMAIANIGGQANSMKLLLAGMSISAVCSAFSSFVVYISNDKEGIQEITYWLLGSLAGAKWPSTMMVLFFVVAGTLFFITQSRALNLMLFGDDVAITLGTDLRKYRHLFLLVSSLLVGFCVYSAGMIGFVGLIIPHMIRLIFGTNHRVLIPLSALTGAVFMIWADVLSRIVIPDSEVPVGILISMIGGPCFIYLMIKKSYGFGGQAS